MYAAVPSASPGLVNIASVVSVGSADTPMFARPSACFEDVRRFDVPVDDSFGVCRIQRVRDFRSPLQYFILRSPPLFDLSGAIHHAHPSSAETFHGSVMRDCSAD